MNPLNRGNSREILLVEDNLGDILLLVQAFKESGVRATLKVVGDGEEALRYLNQEGQYSEVRTPDFILLDLNLPRMDGRAFLREIKSEERFKSIPVIVLSSSRLESDVRESYDMSASCYIPKPFDLHGFLRAVKSLNDFWMGHVQLPSKAGNESEFQTG
jgi:two-component system, chemotaxis family, response regulator Rcp1